MRDRIETLGTVCHQGHCSNAGEVSSRPVARQLASENLNVRSRESQMNYNREIVVPALYRKVYYLLMNSLQSWKLTRWEHGCRPPASEPLES